MIQEDLFFDQSRISDTGLTINKNDPSVEAVEIDYKGQKLNLYTVQFPDLQWCSVMDIDLGYWGFKSPLRLQWYHDVTKDISIFYAAQRAVNNLKATDKTEKIDDLIAFIQKKFLGGV